MSKIYLIEYSDEITTISFTQRPNLNELRLIVDDIANNFPYKYRLWDFSNVGLDLSRDEIIEIAKYGKSKFINPSIMAIVAPQDLTFGVSREFEAYREQADSKASVFRKREDAINWLKQAKI